MLERSVSLLSRDLRINGVTGENKDTIEAKHNFLKSQICEKLLFEGRNVRKTYW